MNASTKHLIRRESPARSGWLSSFFEDHRRRFIVAFAAAIAIHEILAGLVPWHTQTIPQAPAEVITIAKLIRIEHRAKPTPKPTAQPIVHTKIVAETHVKPRIVNPGNPSQHHHIKRIASARPTVHTHYHSKPVVVHVPMGGHGAGTSTTAKVATGGVGPGGTGTGESGNGTGTGGAPLAHEPCGYVDMQPTGSPIVDQPTGRIWEHMQITVHFPDGSSQSVDLDYPWYYPARADDPFMPENKNVPATFQFPPSNQTANEPSVVQYVIAHSTADGYTKLRDCPSPAP